MGLKHRNPGNPTLVASTPAGLIVESFRDPERDPLQAELFQNPPHMKDGWLTLNTDPGVGLTLSEDTVAKFGERVHASTT